MIGNMNKNLESYSLRQILYKVATVFPTPAVVQTGPAAASYTFAPGSYEYPFQFKVGLPFGQGV